MQLFNVTADGGPLQMMSSFFMQFLNTTASFMAPFLGMQGIGDPTSIFNTITQQFLSMFGQVSGLWSNTVNNQMVQWRRSLSPIPEFEVEYEVIDQLVGKMVQAQSYLDKISMATNGTAPGGTNPSNGDNYDETMAKRASEARRLIKDVWKCLSSAGYDPYSEYGSMSTNRASPPPPPPPPPSSSSRGSQVPNILHLQEEMLYLWPLLSRHISDETLNHGKVGHRCLNHCFDQSATTITTTSTTSTESFIDESTKTLDVSSEAPATIVPARGEIEFEEFNRDSTSSSRKVKVNP